MTLLLLLLRGAAEMDCFAQKWSDRLNQFVFYKAL